MSKEFQVYLVDDEGSVLKDNINDVLTSGLYCKNILLVSKFIENRFKDMSPDYREIQAKGYLIFFDATYKDEELNMSALDMAERMIYSVPELRDSILILLGSDINEYGSKLAMNGNSEMQNFLSRVKSLPHVVYGKIGDYDSKLNVMIRTIESTAKKKGFDVVRRLPSGEVREEIIEYANSMNKNLCKINNLAKQIIEIEIELPEAKSEEERRLIDCLKHSNNFLYQLVHDISGIKMMLNLNLNSIAGQNKIQNNGLSTSIEKVGNENMPADEPDGM